MLYCSVLKYCIQIFSLYCAHGWIVNVLFVASSASCMKVGTGGNLGLSREYHKQLFGPLFYTWWNCPLS